MRRLICEIGKVCTSPVTCISGISTVDGRKDSLLKFHPFLLYGDNKGSLFTVANPDVSHRSKHLEVRYYKIREYVRDGLVDVKYVKTNQNVADFFTKGLEAPAFNAFRKVIMNNASQPSPNDWDQTLITRLRNKFYPEPQCFTLFSLDVPRDVCSLFCCDYVAVQSLLPFGG